MSSACTRKKADEPAETSLNAVDDVVSFGGIGVYNSWRVLRIDVEANTELRLFIFGSCRGEQTARVLHRVALENSKEPIMTAEK